MCCVTTFAFHTLPVEDRICRCLADYRMFANGYSINVYIWVRYGNCRTVRANCTMYTLFLLGIRSSSRNCEMFTEVVETGLIFLPPHQQTQADSYDLIVRFLQDALIRDGSPDIGLVARVRWPIITT
jgi:hypothetical protein